MRQKTGIEKAKRPIRILHITFNMGFGGTEQVIRQLVTNLPADEFSNQVLCIDGHVGEIGEQIAEQGIRVFALKRKPGFDWQLAKQIRKEVREQRIDIVHCHQYTPWVYGWLAHIGTSAKVVFTEHGRFHPDRYRIKAIFINPLMASTSHAIVAISRATRQSLAQYEFVPRPKIEVIYNGIRGMTRDEGIALKTRKELGIPEDEFVMGTVARLDPVKNQGMMLEAFSEVLSHQPDSCWLLIVGDGPDREALEEKTRKLGVSKKVIFVGFEAHPEKYLSVMNLFLLSSHTEGASMTLLEALSMGIPIVATRVGGNEEIIDNGITGYLTEPNNKDQFKDAMIRFMSQGENTKKTMSESCQTVFNNRFSISNFIYHYSVFYKALSE